MKGKFFFRVPTYALLIFLSGCMGSDHEDLSQWMAEKRSMAKPKIQPIAEPLVFVPQAYVSVQGADPFSMVKLTQVLSRESAQNASNMALLNAEKNRRKEELESYPLDTMAMVGSLQRDGQQTALLRINNLIYQVKVGNYLGQNYGRIIHISENNMKLREVIQDPGGDWIERETTLDLQEGNK